MTLLLLLALLSGASACRQATPSADAEAQASLSRTEFTDRVENFFEYEPLRAGKPSRFNIHLTDLSEGSPVGSAEVTLTVRSEEGGEATSSQARVGRVPGIYVADVTIPKPGEYTLEFDIRGDGLDERMPLHGFRVE